MEEMILELSFELGGKGSAPPKPKEYAVRRTVLHRGGGWGVVDKRVGSQCNGKWGMGNGPPGDGMRERTQRERERERWVP